MTKTGICTFRIYKAMADMTGRGLSTSVAKPDLSPKIQIGSNRPTSSIEKFWLSGNDFEKPVILIRK